MLYFIEDWKLWNVLENLVWDDLIILVDQKHCKNDFPLNTLCFTNLTRNFHINGTNKRAECSSFKLILNGKHSHLYEVGRCEQGAKHCILCRCHWELICRSYIYCQLLLLHKFSWIQLHLFHFYQFVSNWYCHCVKRKDYS